jgi:hypothetical protein
VHAILCVCVHMHVVSWVRGNSPESALQLRVLWNGEIKPVDFMLQIQVPLSCLPKYSDNDVPGSTSLLLDSTVPEAIKCYHEMQFYEDGAQWTSKHDPCTMCNCHQNLVKCDTVPCPQLTCISKTVPGECCPTCTSELTFYFRVIWRTIYNGPTNALACNKTLIQMSHTKTL